MPKAVPLWRFFVAATVLVIAFGTLVFARRGAPPDLRVSGRVSGTPTPTPQHGGAASGRAEPANYVGSGSWVMSSLPGCFQERERVRGPLAKIRAKFPPAAQRLPPGRVLRVADCTLTVGAHDIRIARGTDRLRIPPEAALYREGRGLTLVFIDGTHAEIRRY